MKSILGLMLGLVAGSALAASSPILENVQVKNKKFAELIFIAIKDKAPTKTSGAITAATIPGLITCQSIVGVVKTDFNCWLLKGGWNYLGSEAYGSGDQEKATRELYNALKLRETNEEGIKFKTIELNVPDRTGGTERNQLVCTRMAPVHRQMGFRDTCQLINAL